MITKEPIHLRQRKTKEGLISLYLDTYLNGKRTYEYLKLYIVPEKTRKDKEQNRQTLELAEAIKAKRIVELRNGKFGFENHKNEKQNFYEYLLKVFEEKKNPIYHSVLKKLSEYDRKLSKRLFSEIDTKYIQNFKNFLENEAVSLTKENSTPLKQNTKCAYFIFLKAVINKALKEKIITNNPFLGVDGIRKEDSVRMYLTLDEVKKLVDTPCNNETLKRAFLFSCLTGLRWSDIAKLTFGDVHQQGEYTRIIFRQKKTKGQEYLDITSEASTLIGNRGEENDLVFNNLCCRFRINKIIKKWCKNAGIEKHITFHCARHTFATMMLDLGTDLYTVSKLLGHRNLATTQIYAKVLDKSKQQAISRIPSILTK